jgi:molecular chaperone GrpE
MAETKKSEEKKETSNIAEAPEMTDKESSEILEKVLNAFKESETPVVENKEAEYLDKLARQQAEFENYRKRMEKERVENAMNANSILITQLLDVVDHFESALKHNKDQGIALIYEELNKILERQGLKKIDAKGKFNPKVHDAVMSVDGDTDGAILEEFQKGYLLNDKLLRASKVKISKVTEKK